jgi:enamine deaminase RidA (YjgF/YER057c/UK114 family)
MEKQLINPPEWKKPYGYSHLVKVKGDAMLFLAGQVAQNAQGELVGKGNICLQFDKILSNIKQVLSAADADVTDIVKMTLYITDRDAYLSQLKEIGAIYSKYFLKYFPAMTLVEVKSLFSPEYPIEIDAIAVV